MAMKDTFYFSHDYTARTDPKIKRLISKHGIAGYGIFWAIVEELYINANALPLQYDTIAYDLRTDEKIIKSVINDFDLFVIKDNFFGSISIQKRLELRNEKSAKARLSALKRWNKDANAKQKQCDGNAIKKMKGKENKEDIDISKKFFSDIEKVQLDEETMIKFKQLSNDIILKCSRIWEMPKPLTSFEFYQLIKNYGRDSVFEKLISLSNRTDLKKRHSAYLTVLNWCEKEKRGK